MARYLFLFTFFILTVSMGQQLDVPFDFRQHNLTKFNASLFDPTLSLTKNEPRSVSLWSRWQWQRIDTDPTSVFLNYTQLLGPRMAVGIGILQNNTGVFTNTGGNMNVAFQTTINDTSSLYFGTNIFAFNQERNQVFDAEIIEGALSQNNFILQFSPALRLRLNDVSLGIVVQNALDFKLTDGEREADRRIFTGIFGYQFLIPFFNTDVKLSPQGYIKSIQGDDAQYGINVLFDHSDFWVQMGYNNFYGISGGAGVTLFDNLSIGTVLEFGTSEPASRESTTIELLLSYHFGKQTFDKKEIKPGIPTDDLLFEKLNKRKNSITSEKSDEQKASEKQLATERKRLAEEEKERQQLERERRAAQARQDSINDAREAILAAELKKARLDSIAKVERDKEVVVRPGEKYEEVDTAEGLQPGFYLIANVFGTERYFQNFMKTLKTKGLEPKSFKRALNGYNYVYLGRYNTVDQARSARDSKLNGRYTDALWIFRVRGE
ncbi:MAG: PorP/SprF family type IX secretion system membrane protein [Croceivirga sp.]